MARKKTYSDGVKRRLRKSTIDGSIRVETAGDGADRTMSTLSRVRSATESRLLGFGAANRYETERRIAGSEVTILAGYLDVMEGVNDDV